LQRITEPGGREPSDDNSQTVKVRTLYDYALGLVGTLGAITYATKAKGIFHCNSKRLEALITSLFSGFSIKSPLPD
jgi:hypothetical protein